ncbi:hypothetical protein BDV93DRAFT_509734 [Ceratobasidium sp. AG-I]|nr:hypothetical protein BDV93DRAFT_509734 [Ceratobasidium sp. AG-I]
MPLLIISPIFALESWSGWVSTLSNLRNRWTNPSEQVIVVMSRTGDPPRQNGNVREYTSYLASSADSIKNFMPSWFAVNMGTGSVSSLLYSFPYGPQRILRALGTAFLILNVLLFVAFCVLSVVRYVRYPEAIHLTYKHPVQSLYLGCIPMGFATIINGALNVNQGYGLGGNTFLYALWGLWWLDSVMALAVYFSMLYTMITRQNHSIKALTAVWLLPTVTPIVPSTTGALLARAIIPHSTSHAMITLFMSTILLFLGLSLTFMILPLYMLRLITEGLPEKTLITSKYLPVGPCGQGGAAFIIIGEVFADMAKRHVSDNVLLNESQPWASLGVYCGFFLWVFGIWWILLSTLGMYETFRWNPPDFAVGFWGMVFPLGVYAFLTLQLSYALGSAFFRGLAATLSVAVCLLWLTLSITTIYHICRSGKRLFDSSCRPTVQGNRGYEEGQVAPTRHNQLTPPKIQLLRTYTRHSLTVPPAADIFLPLVMRNVNVTPGELEDHAEHAVTNCIKNFTPSWFAINMGTGAVSSLLYSFPYGSQPVLHAFGTAFLILNIILFGLFCVLSTIRYVRYPDIIPLMFKHPIQSLYLGCFSMGFSTIINGSLNAYYGYGLGGRSFLYFLWGLWWFDFVLSLLIYFTMLYTMITRQNHNIKALTAVWLLPTVTPIVPSTTGALLARALLPHSIHHTMITLFASGVLLFLGLGLTFMILPLYMLRLITEGLPPNTLITSKFLPVGPCGQGGAAFVIMGQVFAEIAQRGASNNSLLSESQPWALLGVFCGFFLWTFGIWWMLLSAVAIVETFRSNRPKFAIGFWGMVFPLGVYAFLTLQLAQVFDSSFFRVVAAILSVVVFALWTTLTVTTLSEIYRHGERLFNAPCLDQSSTCSSQCSKAMEKPAVA